MTEYRWKGIDQQGKPHSGKAYAPSPDILRQQLQEQGIALLKHRQPYLKKILRYRLGKSRVTPTELAFFFQHLGTLLEHGIPLIKALQACVFQSNSINLKKLVISLIFSIQQGKNFSQALEAHTPDIPSYIQFLIAAAEQTGSLGSTCKNLGAYLESTQEVKSKIKRALFAPAITGIFAILVTLLILLFIVPHFEELFKASRLSLPPITRRIFFLSSLLKSGWGLMLTAIPLSYLVGIRFCSFHVKKITYAVAIKIPYIKNIFFESLSLSFLETINLYIRAGLPLIQGLEQAQALALNTQFATGIQTVTTLVMQGKLLEQALEKSPISLCSKTIISLIGVGEKTGALNLMLEKSIILQHQELTKKLDLISSLVSPILMIILGSIITVLLVTIYLPIFNMALVPHL